MYHTILWLHILKRASLSPMDGPFKLCDYQKDERLIRIRLVTIWIQGCTSHDTTPAINRAGFEFLIERNYARVSLDLLPSLLRSSHRVGPKGVCLKLTIIAPTKYIIYSLKQLLHTYTYLLYVY